LFGHLVFEFWQSVHINLELLLDGVNFSDLFSHVLMQAKLKESVLFDELFVQKTGKLFKELITQVLIQ
jgi:hypothetical protein